MGLRLDDNSKLRIEKRCYLTQRLQNFPQITNFSTFGVYLIQQNHEDKILPESHGGKRIEAPKRSTEVQTLKATDAQEARSASAADMAVVNGMRTNASDGSLSKQANIDAQEPSVGIVFGEQVASRLNPLKEKDLVAPEATLEHLSQTGADLNQAAKSNPVLDPIAQLRKYADAMPSGTERERFVELSREQAKEMSPELKIRLEQRDKLQEHIDQAGLDQASSFTLAQLVKPDSGFKVGSDTKLQKVLIADAHIDEQPDVQIVFKLLSNFDKKLKSDLGLRPDQWPTDEDYQRAAVAETPLRGDDALACAIVVAYRIHGDNRTGMTPSQFGARHIAELRRRGELNALAPTNVSELTSDDVQQRFADDCPFMSTLIDVANRNGIKSILDMVKENSKGGYDVYFPGLKDKKGEYPIHINGLSPVEKMIASGSGHSLYLGVLEKAYGIHIAKAT
ncbi:MAG: hypothetical protein KGS72_20025, partial [Cyanobacteria bacterium REEB67]|nr:hypothetical protein [Cyanobacteria bacterium REEB67]